MYCSKQYACKKYIFFHTRLICIIFSDHGCSCSLHLENVFRTLAFYQNSTFLDDVFLLHFELFCNVYRCADTNKLLLEQNICTKYIF